MDKQKSFAISQTSGCLEKKALNQRRSRSRTNRRPLQQESTNFTGAGAETVTSEISNLHLSVILLYRVKK